MVLVSLKKIYLESLKNHLPDITVEHIKPQLEWAYIYVNHFV